MDETNECSVDKRVENRVLDSPQLRNRPKASESVQKLEEENACLRKELYKLQQQLFASNLEISALTRTVKRLAQEEPRV